MFRKLAAAAAIAGGLTLAGCNAPSIDDIVNKISGGCGLIVIAEQLASALAGVDLSKIDLVQFVKQICDQFTALEQANATPVQPPAQLKARLKAAQPICYNVIVNGKPVIACKD